MAGVPITVHATVLSWGAAVEIDSHAELAGCTGIGLARLDIKDRES